MGCFLFLLITLFAFGMAIQAGERPSVIIGFIVLIIAEVLWIYYRLFVEKVIPGGSYKVSSSGISNSKSRKSKSVFTDASISYSSDNYQSTPESRAYAEGTKEAIESSAASQVAHDISEGFFPPKTSIEKSHDAGYHDQMEGKTDISDS